MEKEGQIIGHLNKGNSGRFPRTIFYFLGVNHANRCQVEAAGK